MSNSKPITMLVVNEHAEEVKLVTISMRGFFPGCRVEAVYSADEALEWVSTSEWQLLLVDDDLGTPGGIAILPELKRHVPSAAIIVQSDHTDSASALRAMRAGADCFLYKKSPAFLTELLFSACEALEKRDLRLQLDSTRERHVRLVETMPDIVYELDPDGKFTYVSGTVTPLLGYAPEELTGTHYSQLLPPDQQRLAEHRFNDRRTGARSARHVELHLLAKGSRESQERSVQAEIHAKGLYDSQHRFQGTVGLVRDLSGTKQQSAKLHQLEIQLQETDRLITEAQRLTAVSQDLQAPLSTLLAESRHLLSAIRELGLEPKLEALTAHAAEAAELGLELSRSIQARSADLVPLAINAQLDEALNAETAGLAAASIVLDRRFDTNLPTILGSLRALRETFTLLLSFIQQRVSVLPGRRSLRVSTCLSPPAVSSSTTLPTLFPLSPVALVEVEFVGGSDGGSSTAPPVAGPTPISSTLLRAYRMIQDHGWTIDIEDSVTGPVRIVLRLTTSETAPHPAPRPTPTSKDSSAETAKAVSPAPLPTPPVTQQIERRRSTRVETSLPVHLTAGTTPSDGTVVNLGAGGALLSFQAPLIGLDNQPVHLVLRTAVSALELHGILRERQRTATEPSSVNLHGTRLAIELSQVRLEEQAVLLSMIQAIQEGALDVAVEGLVPSRKADAGEEREPNGRTVVVSRSLECRNTGGQRLALTEDHARDPVGAGAPVVVLAPGYGCTQTDEIELAYGLAANGLRVIRYDATNHLGLSDGEMQRATLSGMQDDMTSVLSFVRRTWPLAPVLVVASDLAARVALKVAGRQREIRAWLLLNAVVDVQDALTNVHHHDLLADYHSGTRRGVSNLFGLNVDLDHFLQDLVDGGYADLASTLQDIDSIQSPLMFIAVRRTDIAGDRHAWTSPETIQRVLETLEPQGKVASSDRDREPQAISPADPSHWLLHTILKHCRQVLPALTTTTVEQEAPARDIIGRHRLEREQVWAYHDMSHLARRTLWHTHVQHASSLAETSNYWQLLDYLYRRLSPLSQSDVILDVGCGAGEVPRLILMNQAYRSQRRPKQLGKAPRYIGLGTPFQVLGSAKSAFDSFTHELDRGSGGTITAHPPLVADWICTDWHDGLPIADRRCARILSILSLNFVDHPLTSLREMMRTLVPGGRLIVACMTPDTDLAGIYRRHLRRSQQTEFAEPNRTLLLYLGWLRQALCEGLVHAFDHNLLTTLLLQSGALRPRVSSLMGGHILIAVAEKPPSSS